MKTIQPLPLIDTLTRVLDTLKVQRDVDKEFMSEEGLDDLNLQIASVEHHLNVAINSKKVDELLNRTEEIVNG